MDVPPKLLDLIPNEKKWVANMENHGDFSVEKKLELRLGPPGVEDWTISKPRVTDQETAAGVLSLGNNSWGMSNNGGNSTPSTFLRSCSANTQVLAMANESSNLHNNTEKKQFSTTPAKKAVPNNSSQKRAAPAPVVGWPPVRSFRKNLATSSLAKQSPETPTATPNEASLDKPIGQSPRNGFFVKINMDGVPIGRKIDLKSIDSYDKLSSAVDELFRGLLAAQRDFSAVGFESKQLEEKEITGLLDGKGEYTLVYEDNEGDRVLVGDVPWHMFVSTVKRLRVLKTSELSKLCLGSKQQKISADPGLR